MSTVNYNATVTDALKSMSLPTADTDLVIDQFDQWHNPEDTVTAFCEVTWCLVVAQR